MTTLDLWDEWTNDKVDTYLISEEIYFEDRNTAFNMTIFMGVVFMVGSVVTAYVNAPNSTIWPFITFSIAFVALICGITLRINGHIELKRIARLRKIIEKQRLKEQPNPYK